MIDHVYTNKPENICEINVPYLALSDHYPVCITRRLPKVEHKRNHIEIKYRDFKNFTDDEFLSDLLYVDFDALNDINDPTEVLLKFYDQLFDVVNEHAQCKTKRVKSQLKPSWISPEINEARHKRDRYHKLKDTENYKYWRNRVTSYPYHK